jgi:hypothetical protein
MGLRRWLWSVLARGEAPELDPDELIEVALVSPPQAPMTVAPLARHGIDAFPVEQSRYPGGAQLAALVSVEVRRSDSERAARLVADEG